MSTGRDLVTVGKVSGVHGVRGWARVQSFTDPPDNLLDYRPWLLRHDDDERTVTPVETRRHGRGYIVRFEGFDDRDATARLVGATILVRRAQLPPVGRDEYYWADLIGLQVITADGQALGEVERLIETGANDVMVVRGERERLIPWIVGDVVGEVDLEAGRITVRWDPDF